jgi:hypothetical protein
MKTTKILFSMLLVATMATMSRNAMSQVIIGQDKDPEAFSILELISRNIKGLRLPQLTLTQRYAMEATAGFQAEKTGLAEGLTIYNTSLDCVQCWNGTEWTGADCPAEIPGVLVPVPVCPNPLPPLVFMAYNLGAATSITVGTVKYDLTKPKEQMRYLAEQPVLTTDPAIYGGLWQWGRISDGHQKRTPQNNFPTNDTSTEYGPQYITWSSGVYDHATGQIRQGVNSGNGSPAYGKFIKSYNGGYVYKYDWIALEDKSAEPDCNGCYSSNMGMYPARWGNGKSINEASATDDGGIPNANKTAYYQKPVKTVNDPCPGGFRVPTQDEWERLCAYACGTPKSADGYFFTNSGAEKIPNAASPIVWVKVEDGKASSSASWPLFAKTGYAIYDKAVWAAAKIANPNYANGTLNLYEDTAPEPLLFLPAAGRHSEDDGMTGYAGYSGSYWSSTIYNANKYSMRFDVLSVHPDSGNYRITHGQSIRCVAE